MRIDTLRFNNSPLTARAVKSSEKKCTTRSGYKIFPYDEYTLTLAPTYACDLHSNRCYLSPQNPAGLTESNVLRLIDEWSGVVVGDRMAMRGVFHLSGGEPLMLPYLNDILDMLRFNKTLSFKMTTNGINAPKGIISHLIRLNDALNGNMCIEVALDGSNENVNSRFRERGNLKKAVQFIRRLRDSGISVHLKNVVRMENYYDLADYIKLALRLDVQQVNIIPFVANGYIDKMRYGKLDPEVLYKRVLRMMKTGNTRITCLLFGALDNIMFSVVQDKIHAMPAEASLYRGLLYIGPDGEAHSCPVVGHMGRKVGNIKNLSLAQIHRHLGTNRYAAKAYQRSIDFDDYDYCGILGSIIAEDSSTADVERWTLDDV